uniref:Uncharacterized protein n=1 Tax=Arundo donax TaxID=35708 RepID=A0A0A9B5V9_ARUDO
MQNRAYFVQERWRASEIGASVFN